MSEFWDATSAIGTVGATIVALSLAVHEGRVRRRDEWDRQAAQARLVVSTIPGTSATVVNHSETPLLQLRVLRVDADDPTGPVAVRWSDDSPDKRVFDNVAGGKSCSAELRVQGWGPKFHPVHGYEVGTDEGITPSDATNLRLTIQFLDAAGLWWQRVGLQPPTRLLGEPAEPEPNSD
ncbi:hypothetical protein [Streptomyces sp. CA2R101]|uniref:hypothetical protein n=1 Tax=Streptomyces sp. CA2R101 TaxID=3120152 RepID=UPI0030096D3F